MKKVMTLLFAAAAIFLLICGINAYSCVDAIELQKMGFSYRDSLMIVADNQTTGIHLIFLSFLTGFFAFMSPKIWR